MTRKIIKNENNFRFSMHGTHRLVSYLGGVFYVSKHGSSCFLSGIYVKSGKQYAVAADIKV